MKMKMFGYRPNTDDEIEMQNREELEREVNAFISAVDVRHVVLVRDSTISVWYEETRKGAGQTLPSSSKV
ncbi:MAG: hypothetical protein Q7R93_04115 [bacterium]|nr:hypothetical protein [bacterium]